MADLKKIKEFLLSRSILCKKGNMESIKRQVEVIPTSEVIDVIQLLEENKFDEFIIEMEKQGYNFNKK